MKTLVYFASGAIKKEYHDLSFDRIYLIDNCFKNRRLYPKNIFIEGKITCIGMDCLESIEFLAKENIKIDCFVCLNEGLYEGGGSYPINSDFFLGFVMPLLQPRYIHIMDKTYYHKPYRVTMDLPYEIEEIAENDAKYLNPLIFSNRNRAKVLQMKKLNTTPREISITPMLNVKIIHDSIWNYYEELEVVVISFTQQGQCDFFNKVPKVINLSDIQRDEVFNYCEKNKIQKIGFTPWGKGFYNDFIWKLKSRKSSYPNEIMLFHLNRNDYKGMIT